MIRFKFFIAFLVFGGILFSIQPHLFAQTVPDSVFKWTKLDEGMAYCEIDAPEKSPVNDSKLTIVRIDPSKFEFDFFTATEFGGKARSASCWAEEFGLQFVVNTGMYSYGKGHPNKGYLKNYEHINNPRMSGYYNAMLVMHPKDSTRLPFEIIDMTCNGWSSIKGRYNSFCQGMRMIDCNGNPMAFEKNPNQSCSMVLVSSDPEGTIYFVFTRSPYTHKTMIRFLKSFPFDLRQTVYLEGGPEASLYINTGKDTISKFGCYVSKTWERDDNDHFWEIPNVIGIRKKK